MTREEAIELAHEKWIKPNTKSSECIVDILSALGILKLDEPNANDIFHERMAKHYGLTNRESFLRKLDAEGLRIVEK